MTKTSELPKLALTFIEIANQTESARYELSSILFSHPLLKVPCESHRGRSGERFGASGTFQWSPAVQALSILLLETAGAVVNEQSNQKLPELHGQGKSPARSLDYALGKQPNWLVDVFGADSNGTALCRRLFNRSNPEGRRPGPVAVSLNSQFLDPNNVSVYIGTEKIGDSVRLRSIADSIEESAKYWRQTPQEVGVSELLDTEEDKLVTSERKIDFHFYMTPLEIERGMIQCLLKRSIEKNYWFVDREQSNAWNTLIHSGAYPFHTDSVQVLEDSLPLLEKLAPIESNIIALRPGTGEKECVVLKEFKKRQQCHYALVELSRVHIDQSAALVNDKDIHCEGFIADFFEPGVLKRICKVLHSNHYKRNVVLSLGSTLGTYPPGILLGAIERSLNKGDLLIFDCNIRSQTGSYEKEEAEADAALYGDKAYSEYMMMPLRALGISENDGSISFDVHMRLYEGVPTVEHYFTFSSEYHLNCYEYDFRFVAGERINLGYYIRFPIDVMSRLLELRGFQILDITVSKQNKTALFICERNAREVL